MASSQPTSEEALGIRRPEITLDPVDAVEITVLMDNVSDVFMPDQGPAHRKRPGPGDGTLPVSTMVSGLVGESMRAEHGLSLLVGIRKGDDVHRVLYDTGVTPDGMVENMRRLGVDPRDLEAVVCSHGHFDHTAGLDGLIRRLGRPSLPVLVHPDFWFRRRVRLPGQEPMEIPSTSRSALEGAGFTIVEDRRPSFIFERSVLVTGEVDRTTGYEPGFPVQDAWIGDRWQPDPLVLDDQAMVIHVRDRGLVVISGCGHAGIVNITRYARRLTGVDAIHAVIGGFHLNGPLYEAIIPQVCADLAAMNLRYIAPAHCTGWRAQHALARTFGEGFIPSCVGTRFLL